MGAFAWLAGQLDGVILNHAETGDGDRGEVLAVDSLDGSVDAAGQLGVKCQCRLPSLWHPQVFVENGGNLRGRKVSGLELVAVVGDDLIHRAVECNRGVIGLVSALCNIAVADRGDDPNQGETAGEDTAATVEGKLVVVQEVPFKTQTWRKVHAGLGHVGSGEAVQGVVAFSQGLEFLVDVVVDRRIIGHLDAQTSSHLEFFGEGDLVLGVDGILDEIERGGYLFVILVVAVGDGEGCRSGLVYKVIP